MGKKGKKGGRVCSNRKKVTTTELKGKEDSAGKKEEDHRVILNPWLGPKNSQELDQCCRVVTFLREYSMHGMAGVHGKCYSCGTTEDTLGRVLKRCLGCLLVHYCSRGCQLADWKTHKRECPYFKQEKERTKNETKAAQAQHGDVSKRELRDMNREEDTADLMNNPPDGFEESLSIFSYYINNFAFGKRVIGMERPMNRSTLFVHSTCAEIFSNSSFEELREIFIITLVPDHYLVKDEQQSSCIQINPKVLKEILGGKVKFDAMEGGYNWVSLPDNVTDAICCSCGFSQFDGLHERKEFVRECEEKAPRTPYFPHPLTGYQFPFDCRNLASSKDFRDWAANHSWGVVASHSEKDVEGAMVTFFLNLKVLKEI